MVLFVLLAALAVELAMLPRVLLRPNPSVTVLKDVHVPATETSRTGAPAAGEPTTFDRAVLGQLVVESIHNVPNAVPETVVPK